VVDPSPTVTVNSATICQGSSTTLNASGATSYSWNTGATTFSVSVSPSATTVYTVSGTSANCTNIKTATVSVSPLPVLGVTANNTAVCQGQMVALTASGASTYTWNPGNIAGSTANFIPSASTVYTVTGLSSAGCYANNSISIMVSSCTGLFNGNSQFAFDIFPNPTNDLIFINIISEKTFECEVEIFDALGKIVLKRSAIFNKEKHQHQFNLTEFAKGIYFLKMTSKEGSSEVIKVVKD
jgi:hypothetical protein